MGLRGQKPLKSWPCIEDDMMAEVKKVLCTTTKQRQNYLRMAIKCPPLPESQDPAEPAMIPSPEPLEQSVLAELPSAEPLPFDSPKPSSSCEMIGQKAKMWELLSSEKAEFELTKPLPPAPPLPPSPLDIRCSLSWRWVASPGHCFDMKLEKWVRGVAVGTGIVDRREQQRERAEMVL